MQFGVAILKTSPTLKGWQELITNVYKRLWIAKANSAIKFAIKMPYYRNQQHVVFATKSRKNTLLKSIHSELYACIGQTLLFLKCKPLIINGTLDHLHILCDVHPTISMADLVKKIKINSSKYLKCDLQVPMFEGWQEGYSFFSVDKSRIDQVYKYIQDQEVHHEKINSSQELKLLLAEHGIEYDPAYFI